MSHKPFLIASMALSTAAAASRATADVVSTPTVEQTYASSYFGGVHLGVGLSERNVDFHDRIDAGRGRSSGSGVQLTADYDRVISDRWVLGAEAALGDEGPKVKAWNPSTSSYTEEIRPDLDFRTSVRAGYLLTPSTLLYGRAGYDWQGLSHRLLTPVALDDAHGGRAHGPFFGVGVEQALSNRLGVRLEYDRFDQARGFDSDDVTLSAHLKF